MRISLDRLPVEVPAFARLRPEGSVLPFFSYLIREMIVTYADAAALMIANITPNDEMSHHRVGLALPVDMRDEKKQRAAQPNSASSQLKDDRFYISIYPSPGVPASISLVVILSYRLISFWLPTVFGFAAAGCLEKRGFLTENVV
jgi:hypothetical protein